MNDEGTLERIPIDLIDITDNSRPVDTETLKYQDMVASIKAEGLLTPILVRRIPRDSSYILDLVAGHHRLTACKELGFTEVECKVLKDCGDAKKIKLQVQENIHRNDMDPIQVAAAMQRLIDLDPEEYTIPRLMQDFNMRKEAVEDKLRLNYMSDEVKDLVSRGHIKVMNAIELAKLKAPDQIHYVEQAKTMTAADFKAFLKHIVKRAKTLNPKVRPEDGEFVPHPKYRKMSDVKAELEKREFAKKLVKDMTPEEAFTEGVRFAVSMDQFTVKERKLTFERAYKEEERRKKQRQKDRVAADLAKQQAKIKELREKMEKLDNDE